MTAVTLAHAYTDVRMNVLMQIPTLLVGPVGVGKTDVVRQVALNLGFPVIDKRASQLDPTDVSAPMPDHATGKIKNFIPDWLPDVSRDGPNGILLFDELSDAPTGVQAALNQIILERELPGYKLPDGWVVVGTGNRSSDRAAAQRFSRATANRLAIIEIMVDVKAWLNWAAGAGIAPELQAYVMNADRQGKGAEALHKYPSAQGSDAMAFVTPRSLSRVSRYFNASLGLKDSELKRQISYSCGDDCAADVMNFLATYRLLPSLDAILADPVGASLHREPSVNFALTVALVSRMTHANLATIAKYVARLDRLYQAAFWSNAIGKDASFAETAENIAFMIAQQQAS